MSFYSWAFNDPDPYWACYYGVSTHPKYHKCDRCPSSWKCSQSTAKPKKPVNDSDLPCKGKGICMNCPNPLEKCPLFNA